MYQPVVDQREESCLFLVSLWIGAAGLKNAARITGEMIEKKMSRVQVELEGVPNAPAVILVPSTWLTWADERGGGRRYRETLVFSLPLTNQIGEWC